jgi:hypothetical protein
VRIDPRPLFSSPFLIQPVKLEPERAIRSHLEEPVPPERVPVAVLPLVVERDSMATWLSGCW